jgi:hypothetical protein
MTVTQTNNDLWTMPIPVVSFNPTLAQTTPESLFGRHDPTGSVERSLDRAERMARWLRSQENGPWMWIDGQMRQIGLANLALSREMRGTRAHDAAGDRRTTAILAFEEEIEARIRQHLGATPKERENAAAASAAASIDVIPQRQSPRDFDPPVFSATAFIARLEFRGVVFEVGVEGGLSFGPGDRIGPDDYRLISTHQAEIEAAVRVNAEALK